MKFINFWIRLAMCLVMCSALELRAQVLIDDFSDGNDTGWQRNDLTVGTAWGPGTFDASSGAYVLQSHGDVPLGRSEPLLSSFNDSSDPVYSNGYFRATISTTNDTLLYLVMRGNLATLTGYVFGLYAPADGGNGALWYNKIIDGIVIEEIGGIEVTPGFSVGQDWVLEAGAIGNELSMRAWRLGDPEPLTPQWTHSDSTLQQGSLVLGANHWAVLPPSKISATFDNVMFTVPEPSSAVLLGCASIWLVHRRKAIVTMAQ